MKTETLNCCRVGGGYDIGQDGVIGGCYNKGVES